MNVTQLRKFIRRTLSEAWTSTGEMTTGTVNDIQENNSLVDPTPKQLSDSSKPEELGDPVQDIEPDTLTLFQDHMNPSVLPQKQPSLAEVFKIGTINIPGRQS